MAFSINIALLCLLLACIAHAISNHDIKDLVERPKRLNPYVAPTPADSEPELLDIVLLASVDGKFRALNRTSGQTLWSMSSDISSGLTSPASTLAPLIRTIHPEHDPDLTDDFSEQEVYIIEPQSGDIYVMPTPSSPLQRFPFSMSELVDMSPFSFSDSDDPRVFVGRKETSLLLVELETGRIKATLNSACPWDPFEELQKDEDDVDLDELEGAKHSAAPLTEVFIGRTDYHISILRPRSPKSASRAPVQNLSFSTYGPNKQDNLLQAAYSRTSDNSYIQSLPNGQIISFKAGVLDESGSRGEYRWSTRFESPVIAVFDVLRKPSVRASSPPHTFVLLQPSPKLQDLDASFSADLLPNSRSAYVGIVEETGSLFAMSPSRYPLVAFSDASRHERPERIEGKVDSSSELPSNVDDVTRNRKEKERLGRPNPYGTCDQSNQFDRRCLVGVRELEQAEEDKGPSLITGGVDSTSDHANTPVTTSNHNTDSVNANIVADLPEEKRSNLERKPTSIVLQLMAILLGGISLWYFGWNRRSIQPPTEAKAVVVNGITLPQPTLSSDPSPVGPSKPPPLLLKENSTAEEGDDSEREVEDDTEATPASGKRKLRRGKRGNKKKKVLPTPGGDNMEDSFEIVDKVDNPPATSLLTPTPPKPVTTTSLVVSDVVLGFGSHGTVVYQGSFQGRAVAVKRLLQDFVTLASREVSILQESDDHPNVIRYYYQEAHGNFLYIALELCPASLADIIECPDRDQLRDLAIAFDPKKALREITSGLRHLHGLKLVHRDIKPQNILVSFPKSTGNSRGAYRMLISDFGLCKKLDIDQTSFLPTAYGAMAAGTVGWRAPEILRGEVKLDEIGDDQSINSSRGSNSTSGGSASAKPTRLTKSVDIFALGCLFYYTLTNGNHPFGDRYEREVNILKNAKSLDGLERFGEEGSEGADLIEQMLDPEANKRPDTTTCLLHPFFWDSGRRLNFIQEASDRFENMCRDPKDPLLVLLEKDAVNVVGHDWQSRVDKIFLDNLGKFRKYDGRSVQDLLRALRNKKHHYQDLPDNVKRQLGAMPDGYLAYFTRRYPRLFLHVHSVISNTSLRTESVFRSYFNVPD